MMKKQFTISALCLTMLLPSILHAQSGGHNAIDITSKWTWMDGRNNTAQYGVDYQKLGTMGTAYKMVAPPGLGDAYPGTKATPVYWKDTVGMLYFFGGHFNGQNTFNQVWRLNPKDSTWTWLNGGSNFQSNGANGKLVSAPGVPDPGNMPETRDGVNFAADKNGCVWVFGGYDNYTIQTRRNDLWYYNPYTNEWTYFNGSTARKENNGGAYGTKGVADAHNQPGSRGGGWGAAWVDDVAGKFYLFSGLGYGKDASSTTPAGYISDFWSFDIESQKWTWIGGGDSTTTTLIANYGTKGLAAASNFPQPRQGAATWKDKAGNFWMFGGLTNIAGANYYLNDVWKYDPKAGMWTWIAGDKINSTNYPTMIDGKSYGTYGVYGTRGVASATTYPGGRYNASAWVDAEGNFWLFGGIGLAESPASFQRQNDMWKYNPTTNQWTWMNGSNVGVAVVMGTSGNYLPGWQQGGQPGGRGAAAAWADNNGNVWMYSGIGGGASTGVASRSDLWMLQAVPQINNNSIWYVDLSATGNNTGVSWKDAFVSFQSALAAASSGDTIYVAKGKYQPSVAADGSSTNNTDKAFVLKDGVAVFGGFAGNEAGIKARASDSVSLHVTNATILDGTIGATYANHVVISSKLSSFVFDGFTITNGQAASATTLNVNGETLTQNFGGGIYNINSHGVYANLVVKENISKSPQGDEGGGGGMYSENGALTLDRVTFIRNTANANGGAMENHAVKLTVTNSYFLSNTANGDDQGGGAIDNNDITDGTFTNVVFDGNQAPHGEGGAIYCDGSPIKLTRVVISNNRAEEAGGMEADGGSDAVMQEVTFENNEAFDGDGGGLSMWKSSPVLNQVYFYNNKAAGNSGGMNAYNNCNPVMTNVIFRGNEAADNYGGLGIERESKAIITNAEFSHNKAGGKGGGLGTNDSYKDATLIVTNATIVNNTATNGAGGYDQGTTTQLRNSIVVGNYSGADLDVNVALIGLAKHIIFQDGSNVLYLEDGTNPLAMVPLSYPFFIDTLTGNYQLIPGSSPALDKGDNGFYSASATPDLSGITTDLAGANRFVGPSVDIGAYESSVPLTLIEITKLDPSPDYCRNSVVNIAYQTTGTYNAGNAFTAQLSDKDGDFTNATNIGSVSGTATSGTITATIPGTAVTGSKYRIRLVSSNPAITGSDNGTDLNINGSIDMNLFSIKTSPDPAEICEGDEVTLTGNYTSFGVPPGRPTYTWDHGVTDAKAFTPDKTETYTMDARILNCQTSLKVKVIVNPKPVVDATSTPNPAEVCKGDPVTLNYTAGLTPNPMEYNWDKGITNNSPFHPAQTETYTITAKDKVTGCTNTDTITVTVHPLPTITATANPGTDICDGKEVTLNGGGAATYSWNHSVTDGQAFVPAQTETYTVTGTDAHGCIDSTQITVNVKDTAMAAVSDTICAGDTYTFGAQTLDKTGTYTEVFVAANGCDSTVSLSLFINKVDVSITQNGNELKATTGATSYQWLDCNNGKQAVPGATSQTYSSDVAGDFAVVVTNGDCTDTSVCYHLEGKSGIHLTDFSRQITLYPNPNHGQMTVNSGNALNDATVRVINVIGQTVMTQAHVSGNSFRIDIHQYAAGVYYVEIRDGASIARLKFTKE